MEAKNILVISIILILLYVIIRYVIADQKTLTGIISGTTLTTIKAANLTPSGSGVNSNNFTYSIWFYIQDWNYKYGEPKILYGRMGVNTGTASPDKITSLADINIMNPCPAVVLGDKQNDLNISMAVHGGVDPTILSNDDTTDPTTGNIIHHFTVANVPIQKWVNLLISVYGRSLDVYIDGKLVRTSVLPGTPNISTTSDVFVTPSGGFSGWTSKFQYFPNATDPQTAWNIYQQGYGASWLANLFGNYQVKIAFLENGKEDTSYTI